MACTEDSPCKNPMLRWVHCALCKDIVKARKEVLTNCQIIRQHVSPNGDKTPVDSLVDFVQEQALLAAEANVILNWILARKSDREGLVEQARELYQEDGKIEIDSEAEVSEANDATWVAAWVRVPNPGEES